MIGWHRLFGLSLTDYFTGTDYTVELEKDLSLKQQLLDVVIIEKKAGKPPDELPDGLKNLASHNLLTYKSHQESLNSWALDELTGHYVNYRKQISPSLNELLPVRDFRLYAVTTMYPRNLADQVPFRFLSQGVYEVRWGSRKVRIIVLSRIPKVERNSLWLLFSGTAGKIRYAAAHYRERLHEMSTLINQLFVKYNIEGVAVMPYTMEDYRRDYLLEHMHKLPPEERLKGLSNKDLLKFLKERLTLEEIEAYLKELRQRRQV
ncbi:hypothetical protein [Desulfonema magnum]|uniref:Uncharacterized protein n=1 Tax=Desulfonema magnum TaxID=45655 RepID=A0A975BJR6_9BACT|nr:hypothetical protein [Desulfonema magnum]QTA86425.1 Uncharacterized protein dnm_024490 [Desulfonema magnum]